MYSLPLILTNNLWCDIRHSVITAHLLKPVIIYSFKVKCNTPGAHRLSLLWFIGAVRDSWRGEREDHFGESSWLICIHSISLKQATGRERESQMIEWRRLSAHLWSPTATEIFFIAVTYSTVTCDSWDWNEKPSDSDEWSDYDNAFVQGGGWIFLSLVVLTL